ncbi:MBL fold metallo-hydrolase [Clostridium sp. YIM B02505]|uniref:MBL fold metallo-hydrolase n=2 Tax=Clostridium yunnanense TaxID=2800325 RepID=A0ABS1EUF9_9CLOT|nr:MBL fold metallo-hydrolase [Clostridium yunnanense]MBK1813022.1 MBL fold metallo-hydrolase [Clostridium yunnanense]
MKIIEVKGNTFCIDTGNEYIPFYKVNDKEIILLDSGLKTERERIGKLVNDNDFIVKAIICSHAHIDHIGNCSYFKEKYNSIIAMPAYEALLCSSVVNLKVYYSSQTLAEVKENFGHMVCDTDIMIFNNQSHIEVFGLKFNIVHTSGHSPGHICIITPDDVMYLGDTLLSSEIMKAAKLPFAQIISEDLKSKIKLKELKHNKYIVAHKGVYTDIANLIEDNIKQYDVVANSIFRLIDDGMTMDNIKTAVIIAFNIKINSKYRYHLIERLLKPYIEYLSEIGRVETKIQDGELIYSKVICSE